MLVHPDDEPWLRLAIGVVEQAVTDYRIALYREKFCGDTTNNVTALENWFRSKWGQRICFGQGEYIILKVKEEVRLGKRH